MARWPYDPSLSAAGDSRFEVRELADDAAHSTLYQTNGPQAVYSPAAHRTFWAYLGLNRDLYVRTIDHHDNHAVSAAVKADDRTIAANDNHGAPTIDIDLDGHLHIIWSSHSTAGRHVKSDNPLDISAWTAQTLTPNSTYNLIRVDPATGNLYNFYRAGAGHGSSFPAHEYVGMTKSTNGGTSWSSETAVIDTTGTPESHSDAYINGCWVDDDGLFHLVWLTARGTSHDDLRRDWYHAIFDPSTDTLHAADGTDLGSVVTWAEHPDCLVATDAQTNLGSVFVDGDRIVTWWHSPSTSAMRIAVWNGTSWDVTTTDDDGTGAVYPIKDGLRHVTDSDGDRDLILYGGPDDGSYWHQIAELQAAVHQFTNVVGTLGHGPAPAFAMERNQSNEPNSATAADLVPVYMILDEASQEYAGEAASADHDHDDSYYTEAEVDALIDGVDGGAGEILISDTPSTPLVFADLIQNEDQDDLVYSD
jgi:hypothetical protein